MGFNFSNPDLGGVSLSLPRVCVRDLSQEGESLGDRMIRLG